MSRFPHEVVLSKALLQRLTTAERGVPGYQALIWEVVDSLVEERLRVDAELFERLEHHAWDFGRGHWQLLLRDLLAEIEASAGSS